MRIAILIFFLFAPVAGAQAEPLSGDDLRREVSGTTIAGIHLNTRMMFSEYHSPDGRIFGHNGGARVDHGCWDVQGDEVCYYYAGEELPRGTWCWTFQKLANPNEYKLYHARSDTTAVANRREGNPDNWSDNGKPWQCTPLMSRRSLPERLLALRSASQR